MLASPTDARFPRVLSPLLISAFLLASASTATAETFSMPTWVSAPEADQNYPATQTDAVSAPSITTVGTGPWTNSGQGLSYPFSITATTSGGSTTYTPTSSDLLQNGSYVKLANGNLEIPSGSSATFLGNDASGDQVQLAFSNQGTAYMAAYAFSPSSVTLADDYARATLSQDFDGSSLIIAFGGESQTTPEPSSFVAICSVLPFLGGAVCLRRRRAKA